MALIAALLAGAGPLIGVLQPAQAQLTVPAAVEAWQGAITGQLEAFRSGNAAAAFGFAAQEFHLSFPTAQLFYDTLLGSTYKPLLQSLSHSFGEYSQTEAARVLQKVRAVGPDQTIYEAVYRMRLEPEGWRVEGVSFLSKAGVAI